MPHDLLRIRVVSDAQLSPDGRRVPFYPLSEERH
jgi:hypothetical protein